MGPIAFAAAIQSILQTLPTSLRWAVFYLDDGYLLGPPEVVYQSIPTLVQDMAAIGLTVNLAKCSLWGPSPPNSITGPPLPPTHPAHTIPIIP